jgi:hypothetical protein
LEPLSLIAAPILMMVKSFFSSPPIHYRGCNLYVTYLIFWRRKRLAAIMPRWSNSSWNS